MTSAKRPPRASASAKPSAPKSASRRAPARSAAAAADPNHPLPHDELYARILRFLRRFPNRAVDLTPLADELGMPAAALQVEVERMARRQFVTLPFIEPGAGGGAELSQRGLAWLIAHEGGKPRDVPAALQLAKRRVRSEDEAARLPRAEVYGRGR
jgi:hypothetical protein